MLRIGYHISTAKSKDLAFDRAKEVGCTDMQIFLTNPRAWNTETLDEQEQKLFVSKQRSYDIKPVFVHMPYLPNLSSPKPEIHKKSVQCLAQNIELCNKLQIKYLVTHLGSHLGEGKQKAINRISDAFAQIADIIGDVKPLLENEAGYNNSMGSAIEELAEIRNAIKAVDVGFCIDTCHLFAAGYDIGDKEVLHKIDTILGSKNIGLIHLNDAKFEIGSKRDRHDNIGEGFIGVERFKRFLGFDRIASKPIVLETPFNPDVVPEYELALVRKMLQSN